jgi:hypothetical protein
MSHVCSVARNSEAVEESDNSCNKLDDVHDPLCDVAFSERLSERPAMECRVGWEAQDN